MTDTEVFDLLDDAAAGPIIEPPIGLIVDAGQRQLRRRRSYQVGGVAAAVALALASVAAVAGHASHARTKAPLAKPQNVGGPTAAQLKHGRWVQMPTAPVALCAPSVTWDGDELLVIEGGLNQCPRGAAAYDPRTNHWRKIATPPKLDVARDFSFEPQAAWDGRQLLVASPSTGAAAEWTSSTNRWRTLPAVPGAGDISIAWDGRRFVAVNENAQLAVRGQYEPVTTYELDGNRWTQLQSMPRPPTGSYLDLSLTAEGGFVYAVAGTSSVHNNPDDSYNSGSEVLLELNGDSWTRVPLSEQTTKSEILATKVNGSILASGSFCPAGAACSLADLVAALLRPGADPNAVKLDPPRGTPYGRYIAGGANTVVVTYPGGKEAIGGMASSGPPDGGSAIFDIATGRWRTGPTEAASVDAFGTYWTPDGIIALGSNASRGVITTAHLSGTLLKPAR